MSQRVGGGDLSRSYKSSRVFLRDMGNSSMRVKGSKGDRGTVDGQT